MPPVSDRGTSLRGMLALGTIYLQKGYERSSRNPIEAIDDYCAEFVWRGPTTPYGGFPGRGGTTGCIASSLI